MKKIKQNLQIEAVIDMITKEFETSFDFVNNPLKIDGKEALLLYIKTVVDGVQLQDYIIKPFFEMATNEHFQAYLQSIPQYKEIEGKEQILVELTKGSAVIVINDVIILLDLNKVNTDAVLPVNLEPTIQGPELALSEDMATNINLIRHRYHKPSLKVEMLQLGEKTNQSFALIYDYESVNQAVLEKIKQKIDSLNTPLIQTTAELQRLLNDKKRSLLPISLLTERTDRIIYNVSGGKVILLLDGNPVALIAPAVFVDFMSATEDNYRPFWVTIFNKLLRYLGLIICLTLPALYVAISSYNPEVFRFELALSVSGSRIGVPYPSFIEVLFMLIVMELLIEASIRLPKVIAGTATTVGGLILGTAATEAALTSTIMIIIVSAMAISTFVIPINELGFAVRIIKYGVLLFATIGGLLGITVFLLGFMMYMSNMESFGEPYFKLYIQRKNAEIERSKS
ncbi:spore germination protein [Niallia sp. Krafla_26]|uniref:spore germination protein n=1 Tax=Niallia sp. Krafla_26 TaxID=3064703 RepID=UPI003D18055D